MSQGKITIHRDSKKMVDLNSIGGLAMMQLGIGKVWGRGVLCQPDGGTGKTFALPGNNQKESKRRTGVRKKSREKIL